jgi:succinate dehydrogenase hydrophobic anchor subunit
MRIAIAGAVVAVLLVLGMVGFVMHHQSNKQPLGVPAGGAPGAKVETISHGELVDISKHLVEGQWTVVEYYADW